MLSGQRAHASTGIHAPYTYATYMILQQQAHAHAYDDLAVACEMAVAHSLPALCCIFATSMLLLLLLVVLLVFAAWPIAKLAYCCFA